jgi:hypothetical protein
MRLSAARALLVLLPWSAALVGAACGDDGTTPGTGGQGGATTATTTAPAVSTGSDPIPCPDCPASAPVCVDGFCNAMCPAESSVCNTDPDGDLTCCGPTEKCCPGVLPAQLCVPKSDECPKVCADGTVCGENELCQLDPYTGMYGCTSSCSEEATCVNRGLPSEINTFCCPLGSRCEDGTCTLADLSIDQARLASSAEVVRQTFSADSCSLMEGCLGAAGQRRLLRFDLGTPNLGEGDLFLGDPEGSDHFEYSSCHEHYHFQGYARYSLLDANNVEVGNGEMQASCVQDFEPWDAGAGPSKYHCGFQGISVGWSGIYEKDLPCQWVDITDIPAGAYTLVAEVNFEQILGESDYSNNVATIPFVIEPESCTDGCGPNHASCCGDTDTCGWAENGLCDCGGFQPWDAVDCGTCTFCTQATSCEGGCTPAADACCDPSNPCALGTDGICACAGTQAWDAVDCATCASSDPDCAPIDTCPMGCADNAGDQCCSDDVVDQCGWAGDGSCDCGGAGWDFLDCASCACN